MKPDDQPTMLLWVDLEMTGLDPQAQRIIEVAVVVTDFDLIEIERYEASIYHPIEVFENAEIWSKENLGDVFEQAQASEQTEKQVQADIVDVIQRNFKDQPAILSGNSIHQDRRFIKQWWPDVDKLLHYRMFDVSSLKIWVSGTQNKKYEKTKQHRALDDINESIEELKWLLEQLRS